MPSKKQGAHHSRAGRPPYDELDLFIRIEAGRRAAGMNVYAYTRNRVLPVVRAGRDGKVLNTISGDRLHSHYYRIRRKLNSWFTPAEDLLPIERIFRETLGLVPADPAGTGLPPVVERLVQERLALI